MACAGARLVLRTRDADLGRTDSDGHRLHLVATANVVCLGPHADIASWAASLENGWQTPDEVYARALHMADQLSGAPYLWAWPRSWTRAIFIRAVERTIHR